VDVTEGLTGIRRTKGAPQISKAVEEFALQRLATTVAGVIAVRVTFAVDEAPAGVAR
jgi:hypothetical protein